MDAELNIAVDFIAPSAPGRYLSYWRMTSPSGQKFGQRVWLLIHVSFLPLTQPLILINQVGSALPFLLNQVDVALAVDSLPNEFEGLNLNLPLPPVAASSSAGNSSNSAAATVPVEPLVTEEKLEHNFPTNDELLVGNGSVMATAPFELSSSSVVYPVVDMSVASSPLASADVEASLLKELEAMGFRQIDLNKEVLRTNRYNLEQSVDELCGVAEWDPILEELREMVSVLEDGFTLCGVRMKRVL